MLTPFGNLINTSLIPVYRQCRRFIADGLMPWASDIDSVVSGIVEGGIVAPNVCANCGASDDPGPGGVKPMPCSVCKTAKYCGRGCQAHFRSKFSRRCLIMHRSLLRGTRLVFRARAQK